MMEVMLSSLVQPRTQVSQVEALAAGFSWANPKPLRKSPNLTRSQEPTQIEFRSDCESCATARQLSEEIRWVRPVEVRLLQESPPAGGADQQAVGQY